MTCSLSLAWCCEESVLSLLQLSYQIIRPSIGSFGNLKFKHVEWYWCFFCVQCYSPVFKKENKNLLLDQGMVQMKTTIHTQWSCDRRKDEWTKLLQHFFAVGWLIICWATCSCYPVQSLKKLCKRRSHCQHLSIMLGYLATGNGFEDLKFMCAMSPQSTGDMFTAWQTDGDWMNIAQYCPQTISYITQPFNITPRQSIILCNIIYVKGYLNTECIIFLQREL